MISKSFTIQASIALIIIIASSLTSSVNAAAIAPAGFSRDRRADSVPAPVMARFDEERRFNEERQFTTPDEAVILECTNDDANSDADFGCLSTQGALDQCLANNSNDLQGCLQNSCPNTSSAVIQCIVSISNGDDVFFRRRAVETAPRD